MNIESDFPGKLRVSLSNIDMKELDLTYEQIDYDDPHTRSILQNLLKMSGENDRFKGAGKLLIEVFPTKENGCTVVYTAVEPKSPGRSRLRLRQAEQTCAYLYEFHDLNELISAAKHVKKSVKASSMFWLDDKYSLLFYNPSENVKMIMSEYAAGHSNSVADIWYIEEHGKCLIKCGAVAVMANL